MLTAFCTDIHCSYAFFRCPSLYRGSHYCTVWKLLLKLNAHNIIHIMDYRNNMVCSTVLSVYVIPCHTVYVSYHVISAVCGKVTNMLTAFCTDIHCSYATFRCPSLYRGSHMLTALYCIC